MGQEVRIGLGIVVTTAHTEFWRALDQFIKEQIPERGAEIELFQFHNWGIPATSDPVTVEFIETEKEE